MYIANNNPNTRLIYVIKHYAIKVHFYTAVIGWLPFDVVGSGSVLSLLENLLVVRVVCSGRISFSLNRDHSLTRSNLVSEIP